MDFCIYDSRLPIFKEPFGAVAAGTSVRFSICLPKDLLPCKVEFVLCSDGENDRFFPMELCESNLRFNRYTLTYTPRHPKLHFYYFQVTEADGTLHIIHANESMRGELNLHSDRYWQLTVYSPSQKRPAALGNGIIYQIFPDRFCNSGSPKQNVPADRTLRTDWGNLPVYLPNEKGEVTNSDYFGGDLAGITQHLDYLAQLGVTCLYLNPIFEAHSNHRYNTADYLHIDPLLGTEEDFAQLCAKAKQYGISVILDGVFSHTGSDSVYFNRNGRYGQHSGAYRDPNSPYREWYTFHRYPDSYESWWGFLTLPNVRENNPQYMDFICDPKTGVLAKWLRLGASGFRLDVADELPDAFLDRVYQTVKSFGEDKIVIGEVWEDASNKISYGNRRRYLLGSQMDGVMNYPFRSSVLDYILSGDPDEFLNDVVSIVENYPPPAMSSMMNSLSTHDTPRAITVLAGESMEGKQRPWQAEHHYLPMDAYRHGQVLLKLASTLQYFLPGVPCLYYGDEAGLSGYADPFNRCCYPWGFENHELVDWFCQLGQLRLSMPFLTEATFMPLAVDHDLCAYIRSQDEQKLLVAINRAYHPRELSLPSEFASAQVHLLLGGYENGVLQRESAVLLSLCQQPHDLAI
ncbi:MAG: glycoside hydrolase family 13 protein [Negativibacillus sp.]